jgi:hypothetical protein
MMMKYFPHYYSNHRTIFTSVMFILNETTITNVVKDKKTTKIMEKIVKLDDSMRDSLDSLLEVVN